MDDTKNGCTLHISEKNKNMEKAEAQQLRLWGTNQKFEGLSPKTDKLPLNPLTHSAPGMLCPV